ncbi:hypothetical protein SCHPADRAFT_898077 [Schizopora paradoxa]|uniref:Carbohydrate-binding module family 19 domain-containing protein n=1 Tax=Schizopora paradoxa TaxID=27342 RepID=A0A0H2S714_9AGAM|nr:hypothetical protein SCHPADRAFT_898077 [Schizopora paradoxa]
MKSFSTLFALSLALASYGAPAPASFTKQNGQDAIALNQKFQSLNANSACTSGENACVNQQFAQCVNGKFVLTSCGSGLICSALPLVNSAGTSITCTTQADADSRIAATGATGGSTNNNNQQSSSPTPSSTSSAKSTKSTSSSNNNANNNSSNGNNNSGNGNNNNGDLQTSLCLDSSLVQKGFEQDGQETPAAGQVASLTSSNNYINFCATVPNLPLTNGQQVKTGSCNAAPMGIIAASTNIPTAKFQFPTNFGTVKANTNFTVKMAVSKLTTGNFVNADANYFSAPQQVDGNGLIKGHSHIVIEAINSFQDTTPLDATKFKFFKGLNDKAQGGVLSAVVAGGLPAGTYRMSSINTAANHQPVLVAVAQHGSCDDQVYFTVTNSGKANNKGKN